MVMNFCPRCGKRNTPNGAFCSKCGTKLTEKSDEQIGEKLAAEKLAAEQMEKKLAAERLAAEKLAAEKLAAEQREKKLAQETTKEIRALCPFARDTCTKAKCMDCAVVKLFGKKS